MAEDNKTPTNVAADSTAEEDGLQHSRRLHSAHSTGMESSVLRFKNLNFTVGKNDKKKYILQDVSGTVKWGHVLAIMGPSGAGKTVLISALTLDATFGTTTGSITLNGVPMNDKIFKEHCYVVVQQDKHWPYLTCRETLLYCAELYEVAASGDIAAVVDEIIDKMGLNVCRDTKNARLSGGQRRRLSLGISLLKQPTLLFLDEPTTGLDAAAASNIMQEIVRVAKEERLIILCTIHQPSTKVYNGFDECMIMSKGRLAFSGDVNDAVPYFESIGYQCPPATNPAEFFLDLVNSDFSDDQAVTRILDTWEEKKPDAHGSSHHMKGFGDVDDSQQGVTTTRRAPLRKEIVIMFKRHSTLIVRDPVLYIGRCFVFLFSNLFFAIVYLKARKYNQDQALNKMWVSIWFVSIPSQMGAVAVYALNEEFKSIIRESKNGMVRPYSYVMAKLTLVLPIFFIFAIFSLGIPAFLVQDVNGSAFGIYIILFACLMFLFESFAECLAVWVEDPILGMMNYMNFWFGSFLFGGFLIPLQDLYWPFELFYYIMPFHYFVRSSVYQIFKASTFQSCDPLTNTGSPVCIPSVNGSGTVPGLAVLKGLSRIMPLFSTKDHTASDILVLILIGLVYKFFYVVGVLYKTSRVATIQEDVGAAAK